MTNTSAASPHSVSGAILADGQWLQGTLHIKAGRIERIEGTPVSEAEARPPWIVPGFIDLHVHGGGGRDVMEGGDAIATVARAHTRHGTTTLLATTMTASHDDILKALTAVAEYRARQPAAGSQVAAADVAAEVIGVHLEGPYLNPGKLGAQPDCTRTATPAELDQYHARVPLKVITLAPEMLEDNGSLEWLVAQGIKVQAGHTLADYATAQSAFQAGVTGFTHLYNAMPPLKHRDAGLLGFALANAEYAEIIPDLEHVDAGAIKVALRAIPKLYAITDGTAACCMPDGEYRLGTQKVFKQGGCVRLAEGGLAGSCLTLDQAVRNFMSLGCSLAEACERVATIPAAYLGLEDRGLLREGLRADIAVLDRRHEIKAVLCNGNALA